MAKIGLNVTKFMATPSLKKDTLEIKDGPKYEKSSSRTATQTITQNSATLDVGNNLMVNSKGDVNVVASNVDVGRNALMYDRRNIEDATNLYHSQGTIIGKGAMDLYSRTFQNGINLNGNNLPNSNNTMINPTQHFIAVGPAVLREDWISATNKLKVQQDYKHDSRDPILYLAAPSNIITDVAKLTGNEINSPIYIPNIFTDIPLGIWNAALHMNNHDVKNPDYSQFLKQNQEHTNTRDILVLPSSNNK